MASMTEAQAKKFLTSETKRWAHVVAGRDNITVKFEKSLKGAHGECGRHTIWYSIKSILVNLDNKQALSDLALHEAIHLKILDHGPLFHKEFEKWAGHHEDVGQSLNSSRYMTMKKRGEGKTLVGKYKVTYVRMTKTEKGTLQEYVKTKALTKTDALKIFNMASSKNYPAWLYQYEATRLAHGWKKIKYHERVDK